MTTNVGSIISPRENWSPRNSEVVRVAILTGAAAAAAAAAATAATATTATEVATAMRKMERYQFDLPAWV